MSEVEEFIESAYKPLEAHSKTSTLSMRMQLARSGDHFS